MPVGSKPASVRLMIEGNTSHIIWQFILIIYYTELYIQAYRSDNVSKFRHGMYEDLSAKR